MVIVVLMASSEVGGRRVATALSPRAVVALGAAGKGFAFGSVYVCMGRAIAIAWACRRRGRFQSTEVRGGKEG